MSTVASQAGSREIICTVDFSGSPIGQLNMSLTKMGTNGNMLLKQLLMSQHSFPLKTNRWHSLYGQQEIKDGARHPVFFAHPVKHDSCHQTQHANMMKVSNNIFPDPKRAPPQPKLRRIRAEEILTGLLQEINLGIFALRKVTTARVVLL